MAQRNLSTVNVPDDCPTASDYKNMLVANTPPEVLRGVACWLGLEAVERKDDMLYGLALDLSSQLEVKAALDALSNADS